MCAQLKDLGCISVPTHQSELGFVIKSNCYNAGLWAIGYYRACKIFYIDAKNAFIPARKKSKMSCPPAGTQISAERRSAR